MTTPDPSTPSPAPEPAALAETVRVRRAPPARTGPLRTKDALKSAARAPGGAAADAPSGVTDASVSEAVARAVRLGYDVIGQNIEEGRVAAERFRVGQYSLRDVPSDLGALSLRLLGLTRELSTTTFDILEKLLQDPGTLGALARQAAADAADSVAPTAAPGAAAPAAAAPAAADPLAIALTCRFKGSREATVRAAKLTGSPRPTPLSTAGLASLDTGAPAITDVVFTAAPDGYGVVAEITLKSDQPAGLYSGVICGAATQLPLGLLTIEIAP